MVDTAFQTKYRAEYIAAFERSTSLLRPFVTTEANVNGEKAVFLVTETNREAVTRGSNGLIPASSGNQTQYEAILEEWHDLQQKTDFDVTRAQSDQRQIMQEQGVAVINRKVDDQILDQLVTGTIDTGATPTIMTKRLATKMLVTLWSQNVSWNDGRIAVLITPAAWGYMSEIPEFASADYVSGKPNEEGPAMKRWMGATWMLHTGLPGVGTADATMIAFHRNAIGHASAPKSMDVMVGYDGEQAYSWNRVSIYMGAKLLQNNGVVLAHHDDSGLIGS